MAKDNALMLPMIFSFFIFALLAACLNKLFTAPRLAAFPAASFGFAIKFFQMILGVRAGRNAIYIYIYMYIYKASHEWVLKALLRYLDNRVP